MSANDALVRAVSANDVEATKSALAAGADPDAPDATGRALFAGIVSWAVPEIVRLFLEAGARVPREPDADGWTFTHAAATRGDAELLGELIRRGVALDARWERSLMTPLETAAWYGHARCVELLLEAGVTPTPPSGLPSARARAELRGHAAIVALLVARGASTAGEDVSPLPPRDWDDVPGWDRWARFTIARARSSTEDLLPLADVSILRALWQPRGPKRRMLVLGPGISFLPRLLALGGDDVVALDRSPVAIAFARENKIHRLLVEWFFSTLDEGRELAPVRGASTWLVGDARAPGGVTGQHDVVIATGLLHGFSASDRTRVMHAVGGWLRPGGTFHVGLYGGSVLAEALAAEAAAAGVNLRPWNFGR